MYNNLSIFSFQNEIWYPLPLKSKFKYEISTLGRVRCTKSKYCCIKIQRINNIGYPIISIRNSKNNIKRYLVHRLVGIHIIGNHCGKRTVNHINGIKTDNKVENLEWATDSEQAIHRHYILGKNTAIIATSKSKITNQMPVNRYDLLGNFIDTFGSLKKAAMEVKGNPTYISLACKGISKKSYGYRWSFA